MLEVGRKAPLFSLLDADGKMVKIDKLKSKYIVLYFYPRDNTSGCTKEALGFKEAIAEFEKNGAVVIGVSPDSTASHQRFRDKYELPFILLSDPEKEVAKMYGAFGEKKMYGKTSMGIIRSTFILDNDLTIVKVYPKVKVDGHALEVVKYINEGE